MACNNETNNSDRTVSGEGEVQDKSENDNSKEKRGNRNEDKENIENVAEGMEAEEGDLVNVGIAFVYRPRTSKRGLRNRAKNAHLYLAFYLPANAKFRKCSISSSDLKVKSPIYFMLTIASYIG